MMITGTEYIKSPALYAVKPSIPKTGIPFIAHIAAR